MRPTIADVAARAGVSKATVSRVMSGNYDYMRADTRARVEQAIDELDYRPSSVARSLTSKRTYTAAVMVSDVGNPFYADVIHGAEDAALDENYTLYLCNTNYDLDRGLCLVQSFIDKQVDGVLIMSSTMSDEWLEELARNRVPVVVLDWEVRVKEQAVSAIEVDYSSGISEAVKHLLDLGHRQFAHISGPLGLQTSRDRRDAFIQALKLQGINPADVPVAEGNLRIDGGRAAMKQLLSASNQPTAVFAANDLSAMGALAESRLQGLTIPDDLSVIGLDDVWLASQTDPPLTTVALPRYQIGKIAVEQLFCLLDGESPVNLRVKTSLVVRETTTTPKSD